MITKSAKVKSAKERTKFSRLVGKFLPIAKIYLQRKKGPAASGMHNFEPLDSAMLVEAVEQRAEMPELEPDEVRSGRLVNVTAVKVHRM